MGLSGSKLDRQTAQRVGQEISKDLTRLPHKHKHNGGELGHSRDRAYQSADYAYGL
jgi:hypothetical protein